MCNFALGERGSPSFSSSHIPLRNKVYLSIIELLRGNNSLISGYLLLRHYRGLRQLAVFSHHGGSSAS